MFWGIRPGMFEKIPFQIIHDFQPAYICKFRNRLKIENIYGRLSWTWIMVMLYIFSNMWLYLYILAVLILAFLYLLIFFTALDLLVKRTRRRTLFCSAWILNVISSSMVPGFGLFLLLFLNNFDFHGLLPSFYIRAISITVYKQHKKCVFILNY